MINSFFLYFPNSTHGQVCGSTVQVEFNGAQNLGMGSEGCTCGNGDFIGDSQIFTSDDCALVEIVLKFKSGADFDADCITIRLNNGASVYNAETCAYIGSGRGNGNPIYPNGNPADTLVDVSDIDPGGIYQVFVCKDEGSMGANLGAMKVDVPVDCLTMSDATGACCFVDGSCTNALTAMECLMATGVYQGDDSTCDQVSCPLPEPTGACCLTNGRCFVDTEGMCILSNGFYLGDDTICDDVDCSPYIVNPIPTIGQWGLIILSFLLFILGILKLREPAIIKVQ